MASVVGTAVVGDNPEVSIVVDRVGPAAFASAVVASSPAEGTAGAVVASALAVVTRPSTLVAVGEAVVVGLGIVVAVVVADRLGIVVAVRPFAVVGIVQM